MNRYLTFRLYGPMASWGGVVEGNGTLRPSDLHPRRSALLGLLAAAMGIYRTQDDVHSAMSAAYRFAVKVDSEGLLISDLHTTQAPGTITSAKNKHRKVYTRAELLKIAEEDGKISTVLTEREYVTDGVYTVCVRVEGDNPPFTLEQLAEGIRNPGFALCLGRKSCVPALPLSPQVVEAVNIEEALRSVEDSERFLETLLSASADKPALVAWEGDEDPGPGIVRRKTVERMDVPESRVRFTFRMREEHRGYLGPISTEIR